MRQALETGTARDAAGTLQGSGRESHGEHRYLLLDGLRGLLAMAVAIHHFSSTSGHRELFASAPLAVDFFFCLSGFVVAHAYEQRLRTGMGAAGFMRRRLTRLYPMYLVGFAFGIAVIVFTQPATMLALEEAHGVLPVVLNAVYVPLPNNVSLLVQHVLIVGALFPFNNPGWSLFFELVANAMYVVVAFFADGWLTAVVALLGVGLAAAWWLVGPEPGWSLHTMLGGFFRVGFSFFAGVLVFRWRDRLPRFGPAMALAVVLAVTAMVLVPRAAWHSLYWIAAAVVLVPALVALGAACSIPESPLPRRLCEYSGRISYPVYCLHYPLLMLFPLWNDTRSVAHGASLLFFVVATLVISHALLVWFDEPFRASLATRRHAT